MRIIWKEQNMTEHETNLRDLAAMFAMLKMSWGRGQEAEDARDCWLIADEMIKARCPVPDGGIASLKPRRKKAE
jgi:hypothetical protein